MAENDVTAELRRILRLPLSEAERRASELKIKGQGAGAGDDGAPAEVLDRLRVAILERTFNCRELVALAKATRMNPQGTPGRGATKPWRAKGDICLALVGAREDILAGDSGQEHSGDEAVTDANEDAGRLDRVGPEEVVDDTSDGVEALAEKMHEAFTLKDLISLAEREGIKRKGVGWGKEGTPQFRKQDLIQALIIRCSASAWAELKKTSAETLSQNPPCSAIREVPSSDKDQAGDAPAQVAQDLEESQHEPFEDEGSELAAESQVGAIVGLAQSTSWCAFYVDEDSGRNHEYMTQAQYRKMLLHHSLLEPDQDVFHIIAAGNGGPDHPDNYLGALGASFNRSIGARLDAICCFIAGLDKAQKAVSRAMEAESLYRQDPQKHTKLYRKSPPVLYSENRYNIRAGRCLTAADLVDEGRAVFMRGILRQGRPVKSTAPSLRAEDRCSCCGARGRRLKGCSCRGGGSHVCLRPCAAAAVPLVAAVAVS